MYYERVSDYLPDVYQIVYSYKRLRREGNNRETAVARLKDEFQVDHAPETEVERAHLIGVVLALCQKKELVPELREQAIQAIERGLEDQDWNKYGAKEMRRLQEILQDPVLIGPEKEKRYFRKPYAPHWVVGDTFAHRLTTRRAEKLGIAGWEVIVRKIGELEYWNESVSQLVYVHLCPPDQLPASNEEMNRLPCVILFQTGKEHEWLIRRHYVASIDVQSPKYERSYGLRKIGCFTDIRHPLGRKAQEYAGMCLQGILLPEQTYPMFEDYVCDAYAKYGMEPDKVDEETWEEQVLRLYGPEKLEEWKPHMADLKAFQDIFGL